MRSGRPDVAVIGAGLMGRWHATNAQRLGARVVAIVDIDARRAEFVARRYRAGVFASIDAMLAKIQPQAAHVCTPLETHVEYSKRLLSAGCYIVCEKPLAASSEIIDVYRARDAIAGLLKRFPRNIDVTPARLIH